MTGNYANTVHSSSNIPELFFKCCEGSPDSKAYEYPEHRDAPDSNPVIIWKSSSRQETLNRVVQIAFFLQSLGVRPGDRVAIVCGTRPIWLEIDIAVLSLGAVCVSIYPSLPASDVGFILHDSGAKIVFAENQEQLEKIEWLEKNPISVGARDAAPAEDNVLVSINHLCTIEETSEHRKRIKISDVFATQVPDTFLPTLKANIGTLTRETISSIVYTSGTTGAPKGVIQTHGNHLSNVEQSVLSGMFAMDGDLFLFLPLAHSFARLIGYLGFLTPAFLKFCSVASTKTSKVDLLRVSREIVSANSNVLPAVPRLFEKIKSTLESRSHGKKLANFFLRKTLEVSRRHFLAQQHDQASLSLGTIILFQATSSVRKKIRSQIFGSNFTHAISGGAKLPRDITEFFWGLEIPVFEGYGLTETCVATNVNRTHRYRIGSVGPALDKVETLIAPDGEILFKGPNIAKGYYNRPTATAESWDNEGWFHTGDIGHLDTEGFLFITDRKKDLVVTAGGKKIPPQKIENLLTGAHPLIEHALFIGDGKPYCAALVTLSPSIAKKMSSPEIETTLDVVKKKVNETLSSFEAVKKIVVLPHELTVENGFLTPTMKVKRKAVLSAFAEAVEAVFA